MGTKLRLGVIGAGAWTVMSHLPALKTREHEVDFVAVCRKGADALGEVRDEFGFQLASEDYEDVLAAEPDICIIGTPAALHHEQAKAAMEAGAHVLVEKPFTIDPAQAWDLVDTATRLDRHLVVAFGFNYRPLAVRAEELLAEHDIGELEYLMVHMYTPIRGLLTTGHYGEGMPKDSEAATWIDPRISGGGFGQGQLSHALGLAFRLTGAEVAEASAFLGAPAGAPVEFHDAACLRLSNGAICSLGGGSTHAGMHRVVVSAIGSKGQFDLNTEQDFFRVETAEIGVQADVPPGSGAYDCLGPPLTLVDLALGREVVNRSPGPLAARTVDALAAVYASAGAPDRRPIAGAPAKSPLPK